MDGTNYEGCKDGCYREQEGKAGRAGAIALSVTRMHAAPTRIANVHRRWYRRRDVLCMRASKWRPCLIYMCFQSGGKSPHSENMEDGVPTPHLQNVVVTFHIGVNHVDLTHLASVIPWIEYDPRKFAAATMRLAKPRSTCLLFGSGRGVCTGSKTRSEARLAAYSYVCLLKRLGIRCHFASFAVQNIVCAVHCNFRIDLTKMAESESSRCGYEPEMFPGLMYRKKAGGYTIVFLVFESGKCVITGGRSHEDVLTHWTEFYRTVVVRHVAGVCHPPDSEKDAISMHNISLVFGVDSTAILDSSTGADDWEQVVTNLRPEVKALAALVGSARKRKHVTLAPSLCAAP